MAKSLRNAKTEDETLDDVEQAPEASDAQLRRMAELAQTQLDIRARIDDLNGQLAKANQELKTSVEQDLPNAMSECGLEEFTLKGGHRVEVKKLVTASIPEAKRAEALDYMMGIAPDLVKHTVTIEFGMDQSEVFEEFVNDLTERKLPVNVEFKDTVHTGTLRKFVKDCEAAGRMLKEDLLGVFRRTTAEVKLPKAKKDDIP